MRNHSWIKRSSSLETAGNLLFRAEEKVGGNEDHSSFQLGCRFRCGLGRQRCVSRGSLSVRFNGLHLDIFRSLLN